MKKLAIVAAVFTFLIGTHIYAGESFSAPTGDVSNPINADYGGVNLWISTFSAQVSTVGLPALSLQSPAGQYANIGSTTTVSRAKYRIYGAFFSTGNCGASDFIDIWQSTGGFVARQIPGMSAIATLGNQAGQGVGSGLRFYNNQGSTSTAVSGGACAGISALRWPIRLDGNIFFQPSNANYNGAGILYWKEPD